MPLSTQTLDIWGDDCDHITHLGLSIGDPDGFCIPGNSVFLDQPWRANNQQILCSLHTTDGTPSKFDVRAILQKQVDRLKTQNLYPTVAVELEFYLLDESSRQSGRPQIPEPLNICGKPSDLQLYDMRALDRLEPVLTRIQHFADSMNIPAETQLAEFGPGQFEINLKHQSDPLLAADHAVLFKQLVDRAAHESGLLATFMAKPYSEHGSSGQHVHVSLSDKEGNNIFDQTESVNLHHAVAGTLERLQESHLLFAPNANSFKRLQPDGFAPTRIDWGFDHRGVAIRIPESSGKSARIEHRVAGADANPYLVLSAVLAAMADGLSAKNTPAIDPLLPGDTACAQQLTHDWITAIDTFSNSDWVSKCFGESFQSLYSAIKRHEAQTINSLVTDIELQTYLSRV